MGKVAIKDNGIWIKDIVGDERLRRRLNELGSEQTITLVVDGKEGLWQRMRAYKTTGYPTPGLTPVGPAKEQWRSLYLGRRGELVDVALASADEDGQSARLVSATRWEEAPEADREAAWEAFKALRTAGWRSDGPYGPRDELYDRNEK